MKSQVVSVAAVALPLGLAVLLRGRRRFSGYGPIVQAPVQPVQESVVSSPDLLSTVSHEIRTPLTSIKGALELVSSGAMGSVPDDIGNLVRIARDNSDRLMNLVNDLLELRKMESGAVTLNVAQVNLCHILEEVAKVMEPISWSQGVGLEWRCDDAIVFVDGSRCTQVLLNLVHNAIRHSPRRGVVGIEASVDGGMLRLTVDDEGPGVPEAQREEIFRPFSQTVDPGVRNGPSSGLGLSISRRIIVNHGGNIAVERAPRGGARFSIAMPADCRHRISATAS